VTFAGDLPAAKARVALALGLAAGLDGEGIQTLFAPA
jgi:L-asparaginase